MDKNVADKIIELEEKAIGEILTLAEIGLQPRQFKQFKKQVFKLFHEWLKPETREALKSKTPTINLI